MRFLIAVLFLPLLSLVSVAQEKSYTMTFTESQWNVIGKALGKQPYEETAAVIQSIKDQAIAAKVMEDKKAKEDAVELEKLRSGTKKKDLKHEKIDEN